MPSTTIGRGNMSIDVLFQTSLTWSAANLTNQTSELTATIPGLQIGDYVDLYLPNAAMTTGVTIANVRVSAANTLAVTFVVIGSAIVIPTGPWLINLSRPEFLPMPANPI